MPSKARQAFDKSAKDVNRLLQIHTDLGGGAKGRRFGLEVLNKSAIVLITAIWEAYCEDIAAEALNHLVVHLKSSVKLPKELKKKIASEIKSAKNELAVWDLAGTGWRKILSTRLASLTAERNKKLNTPKSSQIDELFTTAIGLASVSSAWTWKRVPPSSARKKLDSYVTLRGAIAHRGSVATSVKKSQVKDYLQHVSKLVGITGGEVNRFVKAATEKQLW